MKRRTLLAGLAAAPILTAAVKGGAAVGAENYATAILSPHQ